MDSLISLIPIIFRGLERLAIVILSGASIYYGYRLFREVPNLNEIEGKFEIGKKIRIYLNKAAPGILFSALGAFVLIVSLQQKIDYKRLDKNGVTTIYGGITQEQPSGNYLPKISNDKKLLHQNRLRLRSTIEFLNSLSSQLKTKPSDDYQRNIIQTKLTLMKTVWADDWGKFEDFEVWAESRTKEPAPQDLEAAARYFNSGQEIPT